MRGMTYDPEADAAYIHLGRGRIDHTEEAGPFLYDVDADGRVIGIEILFCSKVLAPGEWHNAPSPTVERLDAAEWMPTASSRRAANDEATRRRRSATTLGCFASLAMTKGTVERTRLTLEDEP